MERVTKLSVLRSTFAAGDHVGALRIAAKFPRLGEHAVENCVCKSNTTVSGV